MSEERQTYVTDVASNDWHKEAFAEIKTRTNRLEIHMEYVKRVSDSLRLSDVTSCLSIGPADGHLDIPMLNSTLTQCRTYYATEPDECAALDLERRLASECNLDKWSVSHSPIETWEGPPEPVDLVLLFKVLSYVRLEDIRDVIKKCITWTKPGGLLMIKATNRHEFETYGLFSWATIHMDDIRRETEGLEVCVLRDDVVTETLDVKTRSRSMANFLLFKEAQKAFDLMEELCPSGIAEFPQPILVLRRRGKQTASVQT